MGIHWKTKTCLRSLLGKATLAHQSGNQSSCTQAITEEVLLEPSAWNYFNLVGAIWLADPGSEQGGAYFDR